MQDACFEVESVKPFSESLFWQFNRDFYQELGISAWSDNIVPHHMTSNSMVGKTYAELIFGILRDLAEKGEKTERVYLLELGAGHGRLAFHVLQHLEKLIDSSKVPLPPYCYILSDIAEDNLSFFLHHPQFQKYLAKGVLDVCYFDAFDSRKLALRYAKKTINKNELSQPVVAIGNYFFDSIPTDLLHFEKQKVSSCKVSIQSNENPAELSREELIKKISFSYETKVETDAIYNDTVIDNIVESYRQSLSNSFLFFPRKSFTCLDNIEALSTEGIILLSMDKGFHELHKLDNKQVPDIIMHGSFSLWVNYHALGEYCTRNGGTALFPNYSNFHLEIACLLMCKDSKEYKHTNSAYQYFVDDFGPDDFNSFKQFAYGNISRLQLREILALIRLSAYDSIFFIKLLPGIKRAAKSISVDERPRLAQTMNRVWEMYFDIKESFDLAYEIGGLLYDLGYYENAIQFFKRSTKAFGQQADIMYNEVLCLYQLKQDRSFYNLLEQAKELFPENEMIKSLSNLNMD
ncbi:SAM-dependent methyltransferase [Saprospiraceae bacterium]|nr:SAM-dependent methyltransferase [Saprospiraceae bacterium]